MRLAVAKNQYLVQLLVVRKPNAYTHRAAFYIYIWLEKQGKLLRNVIHLVPNE